MILQHILGQVNSGVIQFPADSIVTFIIFRYYSKLFEIIQNCSVFFDILPIFNIIRHFSIIKNCQIKPNFAKKVKKMAADHFVVQSGGLYDLAILYFLSYFLFHDSLERVTVCWKLVSFLHQMSVVINHFTKRRKIRDFITTLIFCCKRPNKGIKQMLHRISKKILYTKFKQE